MIKYFPIVMLLAGCSGLGLDFTDDRTIVIQKSPYLVIASGDLEVTDIEFINTTINTLQQAKFEPFIFTPINVSIEGKETNTEQRTNDK